MKAVSIAALVALALFIAYRDVFSSVPSHVDARSSSPSSRSHRSDYEADFDDEDELADHEPLTKSEELFDEEEDVDDGDHPFDSYHDDVNEFDDEDEDEEVNVYDDEEDEFDTDAYGAESMFKAKRGGPHKGRRSGKKMPNEFVVKVSLCTACEFRAQYQKLSEELQMRYPGLNMVAEGYPVPFISQILSSFFNLLPIMLVFGGDRILNVLGYDAEHAPAWWQAFQNNRFLYFGGIFMVSRMASQVLAQTGAFEVSVDDQLVFSRLKEGRMPEAVEIAAFLNRMGIAAN